MKPGIRSLGAAMLGLALITAPDAAARKFQMSGNWVMRNGGNFIPLQFAQTAGQILGIPQMSVTPRPFIHISKGNLTGAFHFPNTVIPGVGAVTATGSAPATLRVPKHRFVEDAMAALALNGITLAQLTTNFGIDAPFASATLAPGGGPGSFTWCVGDPSCVAHGGMLMTDPPIGMGSMALNGRVIYRRGANQFGGAMQMGLRRGGVNSVIRQGPPFSGGSKPIQILQVRFGGNGSTLRKLAPGGLGSADVPVFDRAYLPPNFSTQPTMYTPPGLILHPGGKVTTMGGVTTMGATGPLRQSVFFTTPMGKPVGRFTTHYGFGHTTGTVFAQLTGYSSTFFTFMGYDKRTPLGAGNIQTVAGGISYRYTPILTAPQATMHRVRMTLGPPVPALSPAGFAAAGLLVLLAAGYALRRGLA